MRKTDIKFGCEFEFSSPWEKVREIAKTCISRHYKKDLLLAKKDHFDSVNNVLWHLKIDSSTECELCTPISSYNDISRICRVIGDIGKKGIKVTKNDSFHLHMSTNGIDPRKIVAAWIGIERGIMKCFPKYRRHKYSSGSFCDQLIPTTSQVVAEMFEKCYEYSIETHHAAMSLYHYEKRKTVEFRIAEGTTDPDLIKNWIYFCMQFMKHSKDIDPFVVLCHVPEKMSVDEIVETVGIKQKGLKTWVRDRYVSLG